MAKKKKEHNEVQEAEEVKPLDTNMESEEDEFEQEEEGENLPEKKKRNIHLSEKKFAALCTVMFQKREDELIAISTDPESPIFQKIISDALLDRQKGFENLLNMYKLFPKKAALIGQSKEKKMTYFTMPVNGVKAKK